MKIIVLIDVWLKSFLFRMIFILDVILGIALQKELWKRQHLLTLTVVNKFAKSLTIKRHLNSIQIIRNFRQTYIRVRECVFLSNEIYGPGLSIWFAFFSIYYIAEVNNFISNLVKGIEIIMLLNNYTYHSIRWYFFVKLFGPVVRHCPNLSVGPQFYVEDKRRKRSNSSLYNSIVDNNWWKECHYEQRGPVVEGSDLCRRR